MSTHQAATSTPEKEKLTYAELVYETVAIVEAASDVHFKGLRVENPPDSGTPNQAGHVRYIRANPQFSPIVDKDWLIKWLGVVRRDRRAHEFSEVPTDESVVGDGRLKDVNERRDKLISCVEKSGSSVIKHMQKHSVEIVKSLIGDQPGSRYLSAVARLDKAQLVNAETKSALLGRGKKLHEQWKENDKKRIRLRDFRPFSSVTLDDWLAQLLCQARAQLWVDDAEAALVAGRMSSEWAELRWLKWLTEDARKVGINLPDNKSSFNTIPGSLQGIVTGHREWPETEFALFRGRQRPAELLNTAIKSLAEHSSAQLTNLCEALPAKVSTAIENMSWFVDVFREMPSSALALKLQPIRDEINELEHADSDDERDFKKRKTADDPLADIDDIGALFIKYYATLFQFQLFRALEHPGYTDEDHSQGGGGAHGRVTAAVSARTARRYNI